MALKDDYLTISEAAGYIGVTRQTISRWVKQGKLKAEKVGREVVIHKKDLLYTQKDENVWQIVSTKIFRPMVDTIREEFDYKKGDKIEPMFHDPRRGFFKFVVEKKDGNVDTIEFYLTTKRVEGGMLLGASKIRRQEYFRIGEDTREPQGADML